MNSEVSSTMTKSRNSPRSTERWLLQAETALRGDVRGRRIAVVPDSVVNPPSGGPDLLASLAGEGWGVVALSPAQLDGPARAAWVDVVVEQVVTLLDDDYEVALVRVDDPAVQEFVTALKETGREVARVLEPGKG